MCAAWPKYQRVVKISQPSDIIINVMVPKAGFSKNSYKNSMLPKYLTKICAIE